MPPQKDPNLPNSTWPDIQDAYTDEFGHVDPEIYNLAGAMWPSVRTRILKAIDDLGEGQRLMIKAVTIVSRRRREQPEQMTNLPAYLSVIFGRLLLEASRKQAGLDQLDAGVAARHSATTGLEADINRTILVQELLQRSDDWTREVYEHLILGYTFEELAPKFGLKANHLRSKWAKKITLLKKQIEKETRAAQQRILQDRRGR